MKLNKLNLGILCATFMFGAQGFSQNSNVVSAALEFQKYQPAFQAQDFDKAKTHLMEAKKFIDPAMKDESTKTDPKANYYNAIINYSLMEMSTYNGDDESLKVYQNDSILDVIETSIGHTESKRRYKSETEDFFKSKVGQAVFIGESMFKQKKYDMAFAGFAGAYKVKEIANIEEEQDAMRTNAIISARNYIDTLSKTGENEKALEFISSALEMFPGSEDLAISGVNIALNNNDLEKAESYFDEAAKASPENKVLFSNMGSIFLTAADKAYAEFNEMEITDEGYQEKSDEVEGLYTKAENNLKRAIEIDPEYAEAAYNLGVLYLGRGEKLKTTAAQMDFNNPDYDKVSKRSQEMYKKAIDPLEIYIKQDPNNSGVLNVLFQVHRNAGNTEKALEYKKRAEAAAAGAE
ncbi:tetratricopeptide repeat protein [Brumimicrobium aurantiacum]|uniref:Tetratricopeptide repeat protein n=1 Tax=Brumimicrobium aurantiacum TaxID=1737063 RepID=A0A3E1F015_9FLAO|nr:tetratricopeptide repeat protein [Brumimicrobium aurantiacum]RFC55151.1 tetratricopeptide repeat protein [Brumimicrobium aurantiacum]